MFIENFDIKNLKGAEYNPRKISEKEIETLKESVKTLGVVKPVIVNEENNIIIAGHQRTKALKALGENTAPVFLIRGINTVDEVRFNQLHNGTDLDCGDENVKCNVEELNLKYGYNLINPNNFTGNFRGKLANVRDSIMKLIMKYGAWGSCVITDKGKVIHASQYALACMILKKDILVYVIKEEDKELYKSFLNKTYGVYSYENLTKNTYIQTLAQKFRLRSEKQGGKSTLYENVVIPNIKKEERGIDFGAGQGDYVRTLSNLGYNIKEMEFFRRKGNQINVAAVKKMINNLFEDLLKNGQYDYVICDSVMNSVDCLDAENAVMGMLNLLCKKGGKIFYSGRPVGNIDKKASLTKQTDKARGIEFLDENNFTALFRNGDWFYQKFHTKEDVERINKKFKIKGIYTENTTAWQINGIKIDEISWEDAQKHLLYEFNLKYNKTDSYNEGQRAIETFKKVLVSK